MRLDSLAASTTAAATLDHLPSVDSVVNRAAVSHTLFSELVEISFMVDGGATVLGDLVVRSAGAVLVVSADFRTTYRESMF